MNKQLKLISQASLIGLLFASCGTTKKVAPSTDSKQEQIGHIIQLKSQGIINDQQASDMMNKVAGIQMPSTPAIPVAPTVSMAPAITVPSITFEANNDGLDLNLPSYQAQTAITEELSSIGSDSMDKMMLLWQKGFSGYHPQCQHSHEGKGSSTAIPALMEGHCNFGPMSRKFKKSEIAKFENRFGYKPKQFRVAVDTLAIYIHPSNPLAQSGITMQQLDAIFSKSRKRGGQAISTWGQLGLTGEWANKEIKAVSRNKASGTYGFFRKKVMQKGKLRKNVKILAGSREIVNSVANDPYSIGYSGIAYNNSTVALLPLSEDASQGFFTPNESNAFSGDYPLTRSLYIALNLKPGATAKAIFREFLTYVYSRQGQKIVREDGYFPVNATIAQKELSKI